MQINQRHRRDDRFLGKSPLKVFHRPVPVYNLLRLKG